MENIHYGRFHCSLQLKLSCDVCVIDCLKFLLLDVICMNRKMEQLMPMWKAIYSNTS